MCTLDWAQTGDPPASASWAWDYTCMPSYPVSKTDLLDKNIIITIFIYSVSPLRDVIKETVKLWWEQQPRLGHTRSSITTGQAEVWLSVMGVTTDVTSVECLLHARNCGRVLIYTPQPSQNLDQVSNAVHRRGAASEDGSEPPWGCMGRKFFVKIAVCLCVYTHLYQRLSPSFFCNYFYFFDR